MRTLVRKIIEWAVGGKVLIERSEHRHDAAAFDAESR